MAKLSQISNLRYYPVFVILLVITAVTLSRVANVVTEHTLLPKLYPSTQPLRVTNNDGTLSNGDKLRGWRNGAFFVVSSLSWMLACVGVTIVLVRVWTVKGRSTGPASRSQ